MAGIHRRFPVGLDEEPVPLDGVAPSAGGSVPAALGIAITPATGVTGSHRFGVALDAVVAESIDRPFSVGADTFRLRRTDQAWQGSSREELIRPREARRILEAVLLHRTHDVGLISLLEMAAFQLKGLDPHGEFVLVRLRTTGSSGAPVAPTAAAPPVKAQRTISTPRSPGGEPAMTQEVAAAQAATLKQAAETGVPFCEECAKAAAQQAAAQQAAGQQAAGAPA